MLASWLQIIIVSLDISRLLHATYVVLMAALHPPKEGLPWASAAAALLRFATRKKTQLDLTVLPQRRSDPSWVEECGLEMVVQLLGVAVRDLQRRQEQLQNQRQHSRHEDKHLPQRTRTPTETKRVPENRSNFGDCDGKDLRSMK